MALQGKLLRDPFVAWPELDMMEVEVSESGSDEDSEQPEIVNEE